MPRRGHVANCKRYICPLAQCLWSQDLSWWWHNSRGSLTKICMTPQWGFYVRSRLVLLFFLVVISGRISKNFLRISISCFCRHMWPRLWVLLEITGRLLCLYPYILYVWVWYVMCLRCKRNGGIKRGYFVFLYLTFIYRR